jgi:hypothetical protein
VGSNANEKKYHQQHAALPFLRRRRLVSNTDRFVGGSYPSWVNLVVLTVGQPLPVSPDERTSSELVGMSQRCHYRAHAVQQWRRHVAAFPRGRDAGEKCESSRTRDD